MKRIISFVLCLSMLVSMLPVSAFAAESEDLIPETTVATEAAAEAQTEAPDEEPTEEATEAATEAVTEEATEEVTEEATEEASEEVTEAATEEAIEEAVEETVPEASEEAEEAIVEETEPEETEPEVETAEITTITGTVDMELESDEVLFALYTESLFSGQELTPYGTAAGNRLTGDRKLAYDALSKLIKQVAAGELDTGVLTIGHNLGKVSVGGVISTYTPMEEVAFTGSSFVYEDLVAIMDALLSDMPYELYWFDKTIAYKAQPLTTSSGKMFLTFSLCVSADYSATGAEGTYDVNTELTGAASAAAENALDIVSEFAALDDIAVLEAYKDRICDLTDYDHDAVNDAATPYGDPWQLIHVFDGDPDTKVVCEGYAKAFQHLCDRSSFSGDISCENVSGVMSAPGQSGGHMWNIVTIDGKNYLVDVTNCDTGFDLFLAGGEPESDGSYTFDGINFAYDEDTLAQWDEELLVLDDHYYTTEAPALPENTISGAEFAALAAEASGQYVLTQNVLITEETAVFSYAQLMLTPDVSITVAEGGHLILDANLNSNNGGTINVEAGGAVTVNWNMGIGYGTMAVAEGAQLTVNGSLAMGGGASVTVDGTLTNNGSINVGMGKLTVGGTYEHNGANIVLDVYGSVSGNVEKSYIQLEATLYGLEGLQEALNRDHAGYAAYIVNLSSPMGETGPSTEAMVLTEDVTIPEGVHLQLNLYNSQVDTLTVAGNLTLDGPMSVASNGVLNVTGKITLNDSLYNTGVINNEGTILMVTGQVVNGGIYNGFEPEQMSALDKFLLAIENAEGDVHVNEAIVLEDNLRISIPGTLCFDEGSALVVSDGATLTLNCPVSFFGSELTVEEGGTLISNQNLSLAAWDGDRNRSSSATINGDFISNGQIWMVGCSEMTVNGYLRTLAEVHVGFDGGASLEINGTMDCFGYLNLVSDHAATGIHVGSNGVLNIGIGTDENGAIASVGFLQAGNRIDVDGTLNINGLCILGTLEYEGGDATIHYLNINAGGVLNIEGLYADPRAELVLLTDGRVNVRGTVKQSGNSFLVNRGGSVEFFDGGVYDESAGFGYIENMPADGAPRGLYYGWLAEQLPRDRITVFGYAESMENIHLLLEAYAEGGYQHGAILVEQDFILYEDLELPEGMALLVGRQDGESVTFEIPQGITLTTRQNVHVYDNARILNNYVFNIAGTATVYGGGTLENNHELAVTETGSLTFEDGAVYQGKGYAAFLFKTPEEHGKVSGIGMEKLTVVNPYATTQEDIQATLDFAQENGCGEVCVFPQGDITLNQNLIIPANAHLQSHGVFTVPENVTVTNNGDFYFSNQMVLNGKWVGNAPYGAGSITGPGSYITQAQLEQLLAEAAAAGEIAWLGWNVILTKDLVLNQDLVVDFTACLEISEGVTLTIGEKGALTVCGELTADNGGKILNNGSFRCELNGSVHMAADTYTAGEKGVLLTDFTAGWMADLTGPDISQQTLHMANCTMEEELRTIINWAQTKGYKGGLVYVTTDIALSDDLEIPENVRIIITEDGSLSVAEEFTVTNKGDVENYGLLAINGRWIGKLWTGDGQVIGITQSISQADFLKMMEEADETVTLDTVLMLTENLELTKDLVISEYGSLVVPEDITLTNGSTIDVYGTLHVEEGAVINNTGCAIWTDVNGHFLMEGQYVGKVGDWSIQSQFDGYAATADIQGFGPGDLLLCGNIRSQEQLRNLINKTRNEGYGNGAGFIAEDISITSDLHIPENVYVEILSQQDDQGNQAGHTVVVEAGAVVTNDGTFVVTAGSALVVDGRWDGKDPTVAENGILKGSFYYMSQDALEAMLEDEGEVSLKKTVVLERDMVLDHQLYLEDLGNLIVPKGITLTVNGLLEVNYTGRVTVEGTLHNAGMINVHYDGIIDVSDGSYEQEDAGFIKLALWGENGQRSKPTIYGVPAHLMHVTVDGNDEELIREAFAMGAKEYGIMINRDMTLSRGLYLPANAAVEICGAGEGEFATVTVPYGSTLTVGGRLTISLNGALIVNGRYAGNLPVMGGVNARFEFGEDADILYTQEDLMRELELYAGSDQAVTLSVDLELSQDLVIPEGVTLLVSGATLTVPKGRTLTANGWLDLMGGTLKVDKGGTVVNNCGLSAMMGSRIDLTNGTYIHGNKDARVHQHFENHYDQNGNILGYSSTVVNIPYEHIAMYFEGMKESSLQTFLLMADALQPMEINIDIRGGELNLSKNTTFPENATVTIQNGKLVVPNGVTLTNNGRIDIDVNGTFIVRSRGKLAGNQPVITSTYGEYINEALYTEAAFRSDIAAAAKTGREIFLSSDITLSADLEIPENVTLTVSGCTLEVPAGVTLTNHGEIWVWQNGYLLGSGGTIANDNLIVVREWGQMTMDSAENYRGIGMGVIRQVYYGNVQGDEFAAVVDNVDPAEIIIVAEGCSEYMIRMALENAAALGNKLRALEIHITEGELRLSDYLAIPGNSLLTIHDGGKLVVPAGVTLENYGFIGIENNGWMILESGSQLDNHSGFEIYWDGHVHVQKGAVLNGNHPGVMDQGAEYENDNILTQNVLEQMLADAANGDGVCMISQSVVLERNLEIPAGVTLLITGRDNFLTIPEGVTVTNRGSVMCHMFGGILGQGGTLTNAGDIRALNWGVVDMQNGLYVRANNAQLVNHHWAYLENDNVSHPTVLVDPQYQAFEAEGDNEYILHELTNHIYGILDSGNVPGAFNATVTGDMHLTSDLSWEAYGVLRITEGCSLTVESGTTLYVYGEMDIRGQLIIEEGGRVIAYRPIPVDREEDIVNNSGYIVNAFDVSIPLERFRIGAEPKVSLDGRAEIRLEEVAPVNANVVDFLYEITQGQAELFIGNCAQGTGPILASRCDSVSIQPHAPGSITVKVTPVVGYDESNQPILSELSDSVTVSVPERFIPFFYGQKQMDVLLKGNDTPGVYAGSYMEFRVGLKDANDFSDIETDLLNVYVNGDPQGYVTLTESNGLYRLSVAKDLPVRTEIRLVTEMTDGSAVANVLPVTLVPAADSVDILLNEWTVTGDTIVHDLGSQPWNLQMHTAAVPGDATLNNDNASLPNGNPLIRWASSDENIARVDDWGHVGFTGNSGEVTFTMTAQYAQELTAKVTFNVVQLPQEITGVPHDQAIIGGSELKLNVTDLHTGEVLADSLSRWFLCDRSGDPVDSHPYASVSEEGLLTTSAVAKETVVYLMAEAVNGKQLVAPVPVTLYPALTQVQILDVNSDPINGKHLLYDLDMMGNTYQLGWEVMPYSGAVESVSWNSSKPAIADIDENGLIRAGGKHGDVTFTMTVTDLGGSKHTASFLMTFGRFTTAISVSAALPDGTVTETLEELIFHSGEKITFTAEGRSYLGEPTGTDISWQVSDTDAATVRNGVLTAKSVTVPTEIIITVTGDDQFASRKIPVIILPEKVETEQGPMEALVICSNYAFVTGTQHPIASFSGEQFYAVDALTGDYVDVTWTSSNEDVAYVYDDGYVETSEGTAPVTITAEDAYGRRSSFTVKVGKVSEFVEITSENGRFVVATGDYLLLTGTVLYSDGSTDENVTWSMVDAKGNPVPETVAVLTDNGILQTAVGLTRATTVTVWAIPADGNPEAEEFVTVTIYPAATGVEILLDDQDITNSVRTLDIAQVGSMKLSAMVYPYHGSNYPMSNGNALQQVDWFSSDEAVATVAADGTVTFHRGGTVTITAQAGSAFASFRLVLTKLMDTLELPGTFTLDAGESQNLTELDGFHIDTQAENQTLAWSMTLADENGNDLGTAVPNTVATLENGLLMTFGSTETRYILVKAEATDGSGLEAQCFVTVTGVNPAAILRHPVSVTVEKGKRAEVTLEATGDGLTYQWYYRNAGESAFTLTADFDGPLYFVEMSMANDGREVYCVITDRFGNSVVSDTVSLNMVKNLVKIVTQPKSVTVDDGAKATVSFQATGDGLTYKWYYKNPGSSKFSLTTSFKSNTYSVTMSAARDGRQVYCVITDAYGNKVQTNTVTLSMKSSLAIVTQPKDVTVASGKTAKVTVKATGEGLTYKWYYKNAGASKFSLTSSFKGSTYSVTMSASRSGRQVYCVITDKYGNKVQTDTVTLITKGTLVIVTQPKSVTVASGKTAKVTVEAAGEGLTYKWYYKNAGASKFSLTSSFKGSTYSLAMSSSRSGRQVYCVITDKYGNKVQTDTVTLITKGTLVIVTQPKNVTVASGKTAKVTVEAVGEGLTYKWYYKNPGSSKFSLTTSFKSNSYSVAMSSSRSGRQVYCVITDTYGNKVQTNTVTLRMS